MLFYSAELTKLLNFSTYSIPTVARAMALCEGNFIKRLNCKLLTRKYRG